VQQTPSEFLSSKQQISTQCKRKTTASMLAGELTNRLLGGGGGVAGGLLGGDGAVNGGLLGRIHDRPCLALALLVAVGGAAHGGLRGCS
jgi:hypothetical protein